MTNIRELREKLDELFPGQYELDVGANQHAILVAVSDFFEGMSREGRLQAVSPIFNEAGLIPSLIELYTPSEAYERGVKISVDTVLAPAAWDEAVSMVASGQIPSKREESHGKFRRIVFYSYKGGVGRTTALIHTAFHLARNGKRVVLVDMDVEAPGLHLVLPRPDGEPIKRGLIDYLWERQVRPYDSHTGEGLETCLVESGRRTAISYTVEDQVSRAQVHVIPAGAVNANYIRKLHTLSYQEALTRSDDAWTLFENELAEQIEPDIILIDARTGLGDWAGLSLLRLAHEVFFVLFPSDQNGDGVKFIREMLTKLNDANIHLVLSPVPEGAVGEDLVNRLLANLEIDPEEEPISIYYNPGVASALFYPVESAMPNYAKIANVLFESATEEEVKYSIQKEDRREIIESLTFPQRDAKSIAAGDFEMFFQKTSDFDRFLDDARWVVRGRKGTGKSTLFHLFVEHQENAIKRARGRLEGIEILPGHGPSAESVFRPTTDEFKTIYNYIRDNKHDWISLWRAYAVVRICTSKKANVADSILRKSEMASLREILRQFSKNAEQQWRSSHTGALLELLESPLSGLCRDFIIDVNRLYSQKGNKLWLLYDDLDQDIQETNEWQGDALGGLLRLAYDSNNQELHNIRFKIFLREDIWNRLVFTNKSHFGDPRTLELRWNIEDFLRLSYRLATKGSAKFQALAQRNYPLTDAELDTANDEVLRQALTPLWGLNQEKGKKAFAARWVYNRMTDSRDNTYPRSLTVLLSAARDEELRRRGESRAVPADRLLSPSSMQAGLKAASVARVNELKDEYPQLRLFLENIESQKTLRSQFHRSELKEVWEKTSQSYFPNFESFLSQIESAGFLTKKKPGAAYEYGIASLYIDGLGVTRVQGEKK